MEIKIAIQIIAYVHAVEAGGKRGGKRIWFHVGTERSTDLAFVSRREELERGEAVHFDCLDLIGCGVHLGDDDVRARGVLLAQLVPDGSQLLAVAAPWRIWKPQR